MHHIEGKIYIPKGLQSNPSFILPDEVVEHVCKEFLLHINKIGVDPMCGVGTIPRVINKIGGACHGIEIDPSQHAIAKNQAKTANIILGDCTKVKTQKYDYIYTSLPFSWFNKKHPSAIVASAFKNMLRRGGTLIIDSAETANRKGETWQLANIQTDYFTKNGFGFDKILNFKTNKQPGCDDSFSELKFTLL